MPDLLAEYIRSLEEQKHPTGEEKPPEGAKARPAMFERLLEAIAAIRPEPRPLKGDPVAVLEHRTANGLSDTAVDCQLYNRVNVQVFVTGTTPSVVLTVRGAARGGANYLTLADAQATQTVTADVSFDVVVGTAFVKVNFASISGTFGAGQGFTVLVTPYVG